MLNGLARVAAIGAVVCAALPAHAQSCTPLKPVGGTGYEVQKNVSVPGAGLISRNNWNTDFVSPVGRSYNYFVSTITPKDNGQYIVQMFLKYANNTADKVYDQKIELKKGVPLRLTGSPRVSGKPYQVNVSVGGVEAVGKTYTVRSSGCFQGKALHH